MAMLATITGEGPTHWDWFVPTVSADGGEGSYSMEAEVNLGAVQLLGAYDSNLNGLIDPSDTWGAYAIEAGVSGNPITVGEDDMPDHWVQIPLDDGDSSTDDAESGLDIVPFTLISGTVGVAGGTFDDLPEGSTVTVAALKYRPTTDLSLTTLASNAYDYDSFEWPDLTGQSSVEFDLGVPANAIVYMWAYADEDGDGIVNESGEMVASGGDDDSGTVVTTATEMTQLLYLGRAE